jgi:hypothetical protein
MSASTPESGRLSDSPLFWFFLFGGMALASLLAIGPKYAARQGRIERMQDARVRIQYTGSAALPQAADDSADAETAAGERPTLVYLGVFIYGAMLVVAAVVTIRHKRSRRIAMLTSEIKSEIHDNSESHEAHAN